MKDLYIGNSASVNDDVVLAVRAKAVALMQKAAHISKQGLIEGK